MTREQFDKGCMFFIGALLWLAVFASIQTVAYQVISRHLGNEPPTHLAGLWVSIVITCRVFWTKRSVVVVPK